MQLTKEEIESFKKLWLGEINEEISNEEAEELANNLLNLLVLMFLSSNEK